MGKSSLCHTWVWGRSNASANRRTATRVEKDWSVSCRDAQIMTHPASPHLFWSLLAESRGSFNVRLITSSVYRSRVVASNGCDLFFKSYSATSIAPAWELKSESFLSLCWWCRLDSKGFCWRVTLGAFRWSRRPSQNIYGSKDMRMVLLWNELWMVLFLSNKASLPTQGPSDRHTIQKALAFQFIISLSSVIIKRNYKQCLLLLLPCLSTILLHALPILAPGFLPPHRTRSVLNPVVSRALLLQGKWDFHQASRCMKFLIWMISPKKRSMLCGWRSKNVNRSGRTVYNCWNASSDIAHYLKTKKTVSEDLKASAQWFPKFENERNIQQRWWSSSFRRNSITMSIKSLPSTMKHVKLPGCRRFIPPNKMKRTFTISVKVIRKRKPWARRSSHCSVCFGHVSWWYHVKYEEE